MEINANGTITLSITEIIERMDEESAKEAIKALCCSDQAIKWVMDFLCDEDEDGWYNSTTPQNRLDLLTRIEDKCLDANGLRYDWRAFQALVRTLKDIRSEAHIYWAMYHHPTANTTTLSEFTRSLNHEDNYTTTRADRDIAEIKDLIEHTLQSLKRQPTQ